MLIIKLVFLCDKGFIKRNLFFFKKKMLVWLISSHIRLFIYLFFNNGKYTQRYFNFIG